MRILGGLWAHFHIFEGVGRAIVSCLLRSPEFTDDGKAFVCSFAAIVKVMAQRGDFFLAPTDPNAKTDTATAQLI